MKTEKFLDHWKFVKECNQCGWLEALYLTIIIRRKDESKIIRGTVSTTNSPKRD